APTGTAPTGTERFLRNEQIYNTSKEFMILTCKKITALLLILMLGIICRIMPNAWADDTGADREMTMLMFVGEDVDILTIASRREESAFQAPAVADVITAEEIKERNITTISQALSMAPGFHMAKKEWGMVPYLRGVPNSVLFLYDTAPTGSEITKSIHPLDYELALTGVKRIEIIRGPGSVLWGPDAFAGIVNVVPMTGKDFSGVETGASFTTPGNGKHGYLNLGYDTGEWDAFLSISLRGDHSDDAGYNVVRFWDDILPSAPADRFGDKRLSNARYLELCGNFSYKEWLNMSFRFSDFNRPYVMAADSNESPAWRENRSAPQEFFKLELAREFASDSALRFTGYVNRTDIHYKVINLDHDQREENIYAELIFDKSFLSGQSLFTGGISSRTNRIAGAPVWDSYLPDYLGSDNIFFLPSVTSRDYKTRLLSVFGQYRHKINRWEMLAGLRYDNHNDYPDHLSYNVGVTWAFHSDWIAKILYGAAYRTPFARQLAEETNLDLEKIKTINGQIAWQPSKETRVSVCAFASKIADHIHEDPYAGLSSPNTQRLSGVEAEGKFSPVSGLELEAGITLIHADGPTETYHYNDYTIINADGTITEHYVDLYYPFDSGPESIVNISATWRPNKGFTAFARMSYFSSTDLVLPRSGESLSCSETFVADAALTWHDLLPKDIELVISATNLFDNDYQVPGTYSRIDGDPFQAAITIRRKW
ncbi:MAG: TonB-dependent receptor plug domain-containing protein, partial [Thermodesulfobacteriota bacterium]|nr:TonB-dependent receptor plug domain-containing protein [Thermodesulfobacteriota bacterium]